MRHPFDGLNVPPGGELTRRGALGALAAAAAGLAGMSGARAQPVVTTEAVGEEGGPRATTLAIGEEGGKRPGRGRPATTEPFGEEAGRVVSHPLPGMEDGRKPMTRARGEAGGPTTKALGEEGGRPRPSTRALGEEGATTAALREAGGLVVPVKPGTATLTDRQKKAMWKKLGDKDPAQGVQACAVLYGAKDVVDFLKGQLKADALKVPEADPKKVARLIADLDSDTHATREAAEKALIALGPDVAPAAELALKTAKSPEQKMRLRRVLDKVGDRADLRQARRGIEVLVALKTPEARALLAALAKGDKKAWLTRAAQEALKRAAK
jgi:hypothetical protein